MDNSNYNSNEELTKNYIANKYEIIKLKKLLKHVERVLRQRCNLRNRYLKIIAKLTVKLNDLIELKEKCDEKIVKLEEHKKVVRKEIRQRQRIRALVRKKRLERLKLMGQFKKSLRKIYLKELKAERKRKKRARKRSKRVHPLIRKINDKILRLIEKRDLTVEKIETLKIKIEKLKKRKNSLGIRALKLKARRIRKRLDELLHPERRSIRKKFVPDEVPVEYKRMAETKIIEFYSERKSEYGPIPKRMSSKATEEPVPIGDKQSDSHFSDSKKKIFMKRRKKNKIEEPLPIGDKRDEQAGIMRKKKRFFRRSRKSIGSDSEQKTPTSDSDANAQPKRTLHKKKLYKRRPSTDGSSTEPITSLKTTTTDNESENLSQVTNTKERSSVNVNTMRKQMTELFKKPVDRTTLLEIKLPEKRRAIQGSENAALKTQPRIRLTKTYLKPLDVYYGDRYYQNPVNTQKSPIREKMKMDRATNQQEQNKTGKDNMQRRADSRKSRQTLMEIDPLEKLVQMGLKSNFVLNDILQSGDSVVDDKILEIAKKSKGIRGMFSSTHLLLSRSSTAVPSHSHFKKSKTTKFVIGLDSMRSRASHHRQHKKSVQISDTPIFDEKPANPSDDVESEEETLETIRDFWNYNDTSTDAETKPITKDPKPKIKRHPKSIKKKYLVPLRSRSLSDGEVKVEHVLKRVCSACGMTDMTQGGFCCPLIPKKQ